MNSYHGSGDTTHQPCFNSSHQGPRHSVVNSNDGRFDYGRSVGGVDGTNGGLGLPYQHANAIFSTQAASRLKANEYDADSGGDDPAMQQVISNSLGIEDNRKMPTAT